MTRFPVLTGEQIITALFNAGFRVVNREGSHIKLAHADGRITIVPVHKGESIGKGLMSKILRDVDLTKEQFLGLIK